MVPKERRGPTAKSKNVKNFHQLKFNWFKFKGGPVKKMHTSGGGAGQQQQSNQTQSVKMQSSEESHKEIHHNQNNNNNNNTFYNDISDSDYEGDDGYKKGKII